MSTTIRPFPELREYAEEEARDCHNRFASLTWGVADGWSELDDDAQATLLRLHVDRICDLTRPASRDAVCRLVGERIGWPAWEVAKAEYGWSTLIALHRKVGLPDPGRWEPHPPWAPTLARIVHALWSEVTP